MFVFSLATGPLSLSPVASSASLAAWAPPLVETLVTFRSGPEFLGDLLPRSSFGPVETFSRSFHGERAVFLQSSSSFGFLFMVLLSALPRISTMYLPPRV